MTKDQADGKSCGTARPAHTPIHPSIPHTLHTHHALTAASQRSRTQRRQTHSFIRHPSISHPIYPYSPPLTLITPCLASTERPLRHTHTPTRATLSLSSPSSARALRQPDRPPSSNPTRSRSISARDPRHTQKAHRRDAAPAHLLTLCHLVWPLPPPTIRRQRLDTPHTHTPGPSARRRVTRRTPRRHARHVRARTRPASHGLQW